jgi:hypothetical protein
LANHVILPVSASTGAGVHRLWLQLRDSALQATVARQRPREQRQEEGDEDSGADYDDDTEEDDDDKPIHAHAVREHRDAALLRKADFIRQLQAYKK